LPSCVCPQRRPSQAARAFPHAALEARLCQQPHGARARPRRAMAALPAMLQLGARAPPPARLHPADGGAAGAWARARLDAAALGAAGAALRLLANAPAALPCPDEDPSVGAQNRQDRLGLG